MAKCSTEHHLSLPVELTPPVTKSEHSWLYMLLQDSLPGTEDTNRGGIFSVTSWPKGKIVGKTKPLLAFSLVQNGRVLSPLEGLLSHAGRRCNLPGSPPWSVGSPPQPPRPRAPTKTCPGEKRPLSAALKSSWQGTQIKQDDDAPRSNPAFLSSVEDDSLLPWDTRYM